MITIPPAHRLWLRQFGSAIMLLCYPVISLYAASTSDFVVPASVYGSKVRINGQIDWPNGQLSLSDVPLVLFLQSALPVDRNGETISFVPDGLGANPSKSIAVLAKELVQRGFAVVRFDNPGVRPPSLGCMDKLSSGGLTNLDIKTLCVDVDVLQTMTIENYQRDVARIVNRVFEIAPRTKDKLILVGFSEGVTHAAAVIANGSVKPRTVVALGGPARSLRDLSKWQSLDRLLAEFIALDINHDGVISRQEIEKGVSTGLAWRTPKHILESQRQRDWKVSDLSDYKKILESNFNNQLAEYKNVGLTLHWIHDVNGTRYPGKTHSWYQFHLYDDTLPLKAFAEARIPSLFIWGSLDSQVPANDEYQTVLAESRRTGLATPILLSGLGHGLNPKGQIVFESSFAPEIAAAIRDFVDRKPISITPPPEARNKGVGYSGSTDVSPKKRVQAGINRQMQN